LLRLLRQHVVSARTRRIDLPENLPGVVAGWIGDRRRGADPDLGLEQRLDQILRVERAARLGDHAQRIPHEHHARPRHCGVGQHLRMRQRRGGKDVECFTVLQALAQFAGWSPHRSKAVAGLLAIVGEDRGERLLQAPRRHHVDIRGGRG
jgi:hypothetical protein